MSIELTPDQWAAVTHGNERPTRVLAPSDDVFVLIPLAEYDSLRGKEHGQTDMDGAYRLMDDVASKEGWDDPRLDVYNACGPPHP